MTEANMSVCLLHRSPSPLLQPLPPSSKTNGAFPPVPTPPSNTVYSSFHWGTHRHTNTCAHTARSNSTVQNEYNKELITTGVVSEGGGVQFLPFLTDKVCVHSIGDDIFSLYIYCICLGLYIYT